jgi:hypothetical protein
MCRLLRCLLRVDGGVCCGKLWTACEPSLLYFHVPNRPFVIENLQAPATLDISTTITIILALLIITDS